MPKRLSREQVTEAVRMLEKSPFHTREAGYRWVARETGISYATIQALGNGNVHARISGGRVSMPCDTKPKPKRNPRASYTLVGIVTCRPWTPEGLRELQEVTHG